MLISNENPLRGTYVNNLFGYEVTMSTNGKICQSRNGLPKTLWFQHTCGGYLLIRKKIIFKLYTWCMVSHVLLFRTINWTKYQKASQLATIHLEYWVIHCFKTSYIRQENLLHIIFLIYCFLLLSSKPIVLVLSIKAIDMYLHISQ